MTALQEQAVQLIRSLPDSEVSFFIDVLRRLAPTATEPYPRETLDAMQETIDITEGRLPAKYYRTVDEMFAENDAEIAEER